MAVAIPDKRKLGRLPGLADTPMVSAPRDYISGAVQNLGRAVQGLGQDVARVQHYDVQKIEESQKYETLAAADRFESERKLAAKERVLNMQPGAPGLASTWQAEDAKVREEFITKQPEFMRPGLKLALTRSGTNLHEYIVGKQDEEANRYAGVQFDKDESRRIGEAMDAMREAKTPEEMRTVLESAKAGSAKWSDNVPQFSPIQKAALKDTLDRRYALALADRVQKDPEFAKRFYDEAKPQQPSGASLAGSTSIAPQARQVLTSVLAKDKDAAVHVDGMKPRFANNLASMIEAAPPEIKSGLGIMSGHRTNERQQQLWDQSDKTGRTVARPGGSRHNHGDAADLAFNGQRLDKAPQAVRDWVRENAPKHGLGLPMDYEPWHVEDFEARSVDNPMGAKVRSAVAGARPDLMAGSAANRAREFPALSPQQFFGAGVDIASLPAGMRNNNPGNIKYVRGSSLPGIVGPSQNTDQGDPQAVFSSPQAGMTAAAQLALRKFDGGRATVNDLIAAKGGWTPGNSQAALNIAKNMGVGANDKINLRDAGQMQGFLRALVKQEHGDAGSKYDAKLVAEASSAALGGEPVVFGQPGRDGGGGYQQPDTFGAVRTRFASLFPNAPEETITTLTERTISGVRQFDQEKRIGIADAMENAPAALQQSGMYTGYMPSRRDFADAYGIEGEKKYEEFQTTNETAKTVHNMQTMPNAEIQRTVEASQPTSTGENAALEGKRSDAIQKAAASVLKARAADPSGYVMSAVPAVRQAWEGVEIGTPEYARAIRTTTEAQLALGIPATQVQPLPAAMAKSAVTMFKDETQAPEARLGAVVQSVFATKDEDQQDAIFRQMVKEGAPPEISAVLAAVKRGEPDAAQRLFTAMTSDPTKLPGVIRDKDALIDQQIETDLMAENQIGDIIYNLSSGSPEAQAKAQRDAPLIKKSVQLYVRDGKSLSDAVAATRRDLWGDVKIYPGQWGVNAMAVIPSSVDDAVLSHGIMNTVPAAMRSALQARAESRIATIDPKDIGVRNVTKQIADRAIDDVIDTSRIISLAPGRLGVSDERTGETYKTPDGKELSWTIEELLAAGKTAPASSSPASLDMWGGGAP